ncbi:IS6 family transposase [Deinococcus peraridilitoris]|uniref:IS6 family transposase n=1 Tax=Deinococcus peraridilitoris TaxID=432329 RepID=UPI000694BEF1|nr:IS6 family transposase [Deinococcus peraridilitoris]
MRQVVEGYGHSKTVSAHAVYLYHRFTLSYRDVQELLVQRGVDVSHETVRSWYQRFGPQYADLLRQREVWRGKTWHMDEVRVVLGDTVHWLCLGQNGRHQPPGRVLARTDGISRLAAGGR